MNVDDVSKEEAELMLELMAVNDQIQELRDVSNEQIRVAAESRALIAEAAQVEADIELGTVESLMRAKETMAHAMDRLIEPLLLGNE